MSLREVVPSSRRARAVLDVVSLLSILALLVFGAVFLPVDEWFSGSEAPDRLLDRNDSTCTMALTTTLKPTRAASGTI